MILDEWKAKALEGAPVALRAWTLARVDELAAACKVETERLEAVVGLVEDSELCRLVAEQADFSIAKLNACSPKGRRGKRTRRVDPDQRRSPYQPGKPPSKL